MSVSVEGILLFQHLDATCARPVQHFAVGVLFVPQGCFRLCVDRLAWHNPQHQTALPREAFQCGGSE